MTLSALSRVTVGALALCLMGLILGVDLARSGAPDLFTAPPCDCARVRTGPDRRALHGAIATPPNPGAWVDGRAGSVEHLVGLNTPKRGTG